jgi:hypothetical protein
MTEVRLLPLALAALLAAASPAVAKDMRPGDLRVCNQSHCVAIRNQAALDAISRFYYGSPAPRVAARAANGARMFQLRFRNGYVTGIVAGAQLDRFLSYGVNLDQFAKGRWYRVPAIAAAELRRLTKSLRPLRLTPAAAALSH